jgi:hypothetical protein
MRRLGQTESKFGLALIAILLVTGQAAAQFEPFAGDWEGDGTIRFSDGSKERMRCSSTYEVRGSTAHELNLIFRCRSDNYIFDLDGRIVADGGGTLEGRWTETSRGVGGTAFGKVEGERFRVRIESSGFGANLLVAMKNDRQRVSIKAGGGGEEAEAQIAMRKK